jgi:hypothetical protein
MNEQAIYRKTTRGQNEIAARDRHLPARLRSLLVMADGKCSGAELVARGKAVGDAVAYLEQLVAEGYIEAIEAATPAPAATPAAAPAAAEAALPALVQFASHQLIARLGPSADTLTARLDACRNLPELVATLEKCREAVRAMGGRSKAEEFWSLVSGRLPPPDAMPS